jgi:hypothetical protein
MAYDEIPESVPPLRGIPHYHGDVVRALFVVAAVLIVVGAAMSAALPVPALGAIAFAVVLILAAGITNPATGWIHWANAALALVSSLIFGYAAVATYRTGGALADPTSFAFTLALALVSLMALYLATRTIRGMLLRELS